MMEKDKSGPAVGLDTTVEDSLKRWLEEGKRIEKVVYKFML